MADEFDQSRNIPDVRGAVKTPILERHAEVQVGSTPDFQNAFNANAESQNTFSAIGTKVAQAASNAQAVKLGYESGKNPHGDLTPSVTEFDKNFEENYHAQANATLSLQGQKLLDDTQVHMSQATRITPKLIANTNQQLQIGLGKIAENAPTAIKGKLETTFSAQILSQDTQYKNKMFEQQREDQKNNQLNAASIYTKNAQEFATNGDTKGSQAAVDSAIKNADALEANKFITPEAARELRETAKQANLNGIYTNEATQAQKEGKYPEFAANYAKNKPVGMTNEQYITTGNHFQQQINFIDGLQKQDENLKSAEFRTQVVEDINAAGSNLIKHQSEVSGIKFQEDKLYYLNALKRKQSLTAESDAVINGWNNKEVYVRSSDKAKDEAFDTQVKRKIITSQNNGNPVSFSDAEAQVAASAAGPVPRMIKLMNSKLSSNNPQDIEDAGKSYQYINQLQKGENLTGVTDQSLAMLNKYMTLRQNGTNAVEAAQAAHDAVYNQKPEQKKISEENWHTIDNSVIKPAGKLNFYSSLSNIDKDSLVDPQGFTEQAEELLKTNFSNTHDDLDTAKRMTQEALQKSYGETYVNGKKQTVFYPLEDVIGIHDSAAFIQDDVIEQTTKQLAETKKAFDEGRSQYYWEIEPRVSPESLSKRTEQIQSEVLAKGFTKESLAYKSANQRATESFSQGSQITIHKIWKNGTRQTYPLVVKADPWLVKLSNVGKPYGGSWDIVLGTSKGWKPLQRLDPMQGEIIYYQPNIEGIRAKAAKVTLGNH
jgi:hypothetical protein